MMNGTANGSRAVCNRRGFTLAELLVANVIVATALLGVYQLFRHVVEIEAAVSRRWEERGAAEAIVTEVSEAIEHAVNLPKGPAIVASPGENGGGSVIVATQPRLHRASVAQWTSIRRHRYDWRVDDSGRGSVEARLRMIGGTRDLSLEGGEDDDEVEAELWARVAPRVIGRGVESLDVEFRSTDDGEWQRFGEWQPGRGAVRVRARVGSQSVEQVVLPRVNATVVAGTEQP